MDRSRADAAVQFAGASATWRAFMEYGNGIVGRHVRPHVRYVALDAGPGLAESVSSTGGILVDKASKANISDTQIATFEFRRFASRLATSLLGRGARPEISVGRRRFMATKGRSKRACTATTSRQPGSADTPGRDLRIRTVSGGQDREGSGAARRARDPPPHAGLSDGYRFARQAGCGYRGRIYFGFELHIGESLDEAGAHAHVGRKGPPRGERYGGETGCWHALTAVASVHPSA